MQQYTVVNKKHTIFNGVTCTPICGEYENIAPPNICPKKYSFRRDLYKYEPFAELICFCILPKIK